MKRLRGRLARGGALAAAVAAVVCLDSGVVPLPLSTPADLAGGRASATSDGRTNLLRTDEAAAERNRTDGITAAVATMAAAFTAGDDAAFVSVVDPAETALIARMTRTYRNLKKIGYRGVAFSWSPDHVESATAAVRNDDLFLRVRPLVAGVEVRTLLPGVDRTPSVSVLPLTFAERAGVWKVIDDRVNTTYGSVVGYYQDAEPWMVASVVVERRPHVVVIGEASRAADVDRLASRLETAVGVVRDVWGVKSWNGKVAAYAITNKDFVYRHFGARAATGKVTKEAVFDAKVTTVTATAVRTEGEEPTPAAARLVVTPFLLARDDAESRAVLRHELTHVAFAFEGGDATPSWLVEGTAEYTGYRTGGSAVDGVGALAKRGLPEETWSQLRRGTWKPTLVADPSVFYAGSGSRVSGTYTTAWLTCLYIADTYGEQSLARLYTAAAAAPAGDDPEKVEATILKQVLKTDRNGLISGVRRYAKRIRGRFV